MGKKRIFLIVVPLLLVLGPMVYLAYAFWAVPAEDRPVLMYFRAAL